MGADITIINGDLFQRIATVACLKECFQEARQDPCHLRSKTIYTRWQNGSGYIFDGKTMRTAVYIKMDSRDPLLLSRGGMPPIRYYFLPSGCRGYHTPRQQTTQATSCSIS